MKKSTTRQRFLLIFLLQIGLIFACNIPQTESGKQTAIAQTIAAGPPEDWFHTPTGSLPTADVGMNNTVTPSNPVLQQETPESTVPLFPEVIIYYAEKEDTYDLYSADYSTGVITNLTDSLSEDYGASCSPDNLQIAFISDRTGNEEIFTMSRSGENVAQITENGTQFKNSIVWMSMSTLLYWDGSPDISGWYTVDIATRNITSVSNGFAQPYISESIPSPDGSAELIEEYNESDETFDLLMRTGGSTVNLTNSPGVDDFNPVWSPDGSKILFSSNRDGDFELFIMDRWGNVLEQFTENNWRDFPSCWLP